MNRMMLDRATGTRNIDQYLAESAVQTCGIICCFLGCSLKQRKEDLKKEEGNTAYQKRERRLGGGGGWGWRWGGGDEE